MRERFFTDRRNRSLTVALLKRLLARALMAETSLRMLLLAAIIFSCRGVTAAPGAMADDNASPHSDAGHMIVVPQVAVGRNPGTDLARSPWDRAACLSGFFDIAGEKLATDRTCVYLLYDRSALWLAFRCEGRSGNELKAAVTQRDGPVWKDDSIEIFLDPARSRDTYYQFVINSAGAVYDACGVDKAFNSNVLVKTATDEKGFSAVVRIAFSQLRTRCPEKGDVWAVNFCRNDSTPSKSSWAPTSGAFTQPEHFGHLVFGDQKTTPARLGDVQPVVIGANRITINSPQTLRYQLEGKDRDGTSIPVGSGKVPEDGIVSFFIDKDTIRRLDLTVLDANGRQFARSWYPTESPEVSERFSLLHQRFRQADQLVPQFEPQPRAKAEPIMTKLRPTLNEASQILTDRGQFTPQNWKRLADVTTSGERELDGVSAYAQTVKHFGKSDFAIGLASSVDKVMIRDFPFEGSFDDHYELALARNEHEGFQVVVMPFHRDLEKVSVSVSPLKHTPKPETSVSPQTTVSLVGHVDVADNPPYEAPYTGWWPDPLLSFQDTCDIRIGEHVAYWIDVSTTADTPAGKYEGTITIRAADCRPITLQLRVTVWDFVLPDGTHLPNAFTYHQPAVKEVYRDRWTREIEYKYYDMILDHRLGIDHLYRRTPPDLETVQYGLARGMRVFNVIFTGKGGRKEDILDLLAKFVPTVKKAGILNQAYVYGFDEVDEASFETVRDLFGEIHRRFPGLKTMTTAYDFSFGRKTRLREAVDIWVPLTDKYDRQEAGALREEGKDMWWYVCVRPHHPYANWFIEYPAIEARLLTGAMSYKYAVGGFLYYQMTLWPAGAQPITSGPYTTWNAGSFTNDRGETANGDGSLLCPGPDGPLSTIRLENIRDGLEDYEYLYLLADITEDARPMPPTSKRNRFVTAAERLLAVPDPVVRSLTEYTGDGRVLYRFRQELAQAITEGNTLIAGETTTSSRQ